jgi:predicted site-specific integrase-resolvase
MSRAAELLYVGYGTLKQWCSVGLVPIITIEGKIKVDSRFVDGLAQKLRLERMFRGPTQLVQPSIVAKLYRLAYDFSNLEGAIATAALRAHKEEIRAQVRVLYADRMIVELPELVDLLKPYVRRWTVYSWLHKGRLPAVAIGGKYYLTSATCEYIVWFYANCKTILDVAALSGYDTSWIAAQARKGIWPALFGPDGRMPRFRPEIVNVICASRAQQRLMSIQEAAVRLKVSASLLEQYVTSAMPARRPISSKPRITEEFVQEWQRKFTTLNPGFEWLEHVISPGKDPRTVNGYRAKRLLGISKTSLSQWRKKGVLPFYCRTFGKEAKSPYIDFVEIYLTSLVRFAGGKVTFAHAQEYLRLCTKARNLV